ncbi:MAG: cation diffusion facilitator family transporter [Actinomycetota bacterium]
MAAGGGTRVVIAALLGNSAIAVAKFVGFLITGSSSMMAEAIHSVADSGNQGLLLWGGRAARREADDEHQFGYGRERFFWAFVVALVLFLVGSGFALYEGIEKIRHPHPIDNAIVAYCILGFGIVAEGFALRTAIVESRRVKRSDETWWQFVRGTRVPELAVVLLEDIGAMTGLVFAMVSVFIADTFDAPVWDGIGTLSIGILLLVIAIVLIIEMRSMLLGEGARPDKMRAIRSAIENTEGVAGIVDLRTQYFGPEELLVAGKVEFDPGLDTRTLAETIDAVERNVREIAPHARLTYIEPDLQREF